VRQVRHLALPHLWLMYPNRVHDGVNQAEAGSLGELLRLQQQLAAVRSDRFVGFDAAEDKVLVAQVAERRDENPLQRGLPPVIGLAADRAEVRSEEHTSELQSR